MKIALTFLTLSVVLLLGSLMWGMKTYTDLAHALSDVADLKQELDRYRPGAGGVGGNVYPVAMPGIVAQAPGSPQPVPAAPVAAPTLDEAEIEARLEEMIATRLNDRPEVDVAAVKRDQELSAMETELSALEREGSAIDRERKSIMSDRENVDEGPLLTDGQNKIATAPILATVTQANAQYSFVVMDAGENKNLEVGQTYSIRRNHMIIGEAIIDAVEPREAVANVKPSSIPQGIVLKIGDHVVEFTGKNEL
ncbi:MAG: hypothetical protein ACI9R3_000575 [Verrucomicrobiales bacterium]|jgi:hypothetical protein